MGKLIILSGPSGAGKSTIVESLLQNEDFNLTFSISATSRKKRDDEQDGVNYHFLSIDDFKSKIEEDRFLEWEEVYKNQYYGTLKNDVSQLLSEGKNVIFDIDVMGGINIKRQYKDDAITIFIAPPSLEVLEERLKSRKTEDEAHLKKRLNKAKMEMHYARKFQHQVVNDKLEETISAATKLVEEFLK